MASKDVWLPGTLNRKNFQVNSSVTSQPDTSDDNPNNDWDGSNIAAVYSNNFPAGPGARLYYHFGKLNGSQWIQEIIWDQNTDTWEAGAALEGASPNSHIAATIDDHNKAVRVFYCSGNRTLQESWLNMSQPNGKYEAGTHLLSRTDRHDIY